MLAFRGVVCRLHRVGLLFAVAACVGLLGAPSVFAVPQVMPDRWTQFVTDDGWVVDVNSTQEVIDHIDNLAGASNSWQARVTLRAEARITGTGAAPIQDAQLEAGYFVGSTSASGRSTLSPRKQTPDAIREGG